MDEEVRVTILGHAGKKLNVSERYGFIDDSELVKAIDRFSYGNGLKIEAKNWVMLANCRIG